MKRIRGCVEYLNYDTGEVTEDYARAISWYVDEMVPVWVMFGDFVIDEWLVELQEVPIELAAKYADLNEA